MGNAPEENAVRFCKEHIVDKFPLKNYEELEQHQSKPLTIGSIYNEDEMEDNGPIIWEAINEPAAEEDYGEEAEEEL